MYKEFLRIANEPVDTKDTSISGFFNNKITPRYNSAFRMDAVNAFRKLFNNNKLTFIDVEDKYLNKLKDESLVDKLFQGTDKENQVLASVLLTVFSDKISDYSSLKSKIIEFLDRKVD